MRQTNSQAIELLNEYDFYFVIILNPDGYKYSHDVEVCLFLRLLLDTYAKILLAFLA